MQTFLPYSDFALSVNCLDSKRLGKQRLESKTILNTLIGKSEGWKHHPCVKQWKGYENALRLYYNFCLKEWINRGFKNTMEYEDIEEGIIYPLWLGRSNYHSSHRSALLFKNLDYYSQFSWVERPKLDYVWPKNSLK